MAGRPKPFGHQRVPATEWSTSGAQRAQPVTTGGKWDALVTRPNPNWLMEELAHVGREDPTADPRRHAESTPISISDFVSARTFARTRIYAHVCEPLGVADSLRLYLPPSHASVRFFFLENAYRKLAVHNPPPPSRGCRIRPPSSTRPDVRRHLPERRPQPTVRAGRA
jgi:hypothetical protein